MKQKGPPIQVQGKAYHRARRWQAALKDDRCRRILQVLLNNKLGLHQRELARQTKLHNFTVKRLIEGEVKRKSSLIGLVWFSKKKSRCQTYYTLTAEGQHIAELLQNNHNFSDDELLLIATHRVLNEEVARYKKHKTPDLQTLAFAIAEYLQET